MAEKDSILQSALTKVGASDQKLRQKTIQRDSKEIFEESLETCTQSALPVRLTKTDCATEKRCVPYVRTVRGKPTAHARPKRFTQPKQLSVDGKQFPKMDCTCHAKIITDHLSPRVAEKLVGELIAQTTAKARHTYNLRPSSKRANVKCEISTGYTSGNGQTEMERLIRFISNTGIVTNSSEAAKNYSVHNAGEISCSADYSPLIVSEPDGFSVRIYNRSKSVSEEEISYHCSRCDNLCRKSENELGRVILKTKRGVIVDMYPAHHLQCLPVAVELLKGLGSGLKNFCVVANHKIISLRAMAESDFGDCHELYEGLCTNRLHQQDCDSAVDEKNSGSSAVKTVAEDGEQNCSCKRFYEENVALYQEMIGNLDEMRNLVNELKHMGGAGTEYYIEGEFVEGDNGAIYVIDEDVFPS